MPFFTPGTLEESVISGEFERAGQRALPVLCVHADQSTKADIDAKVDPSLRLEPDMPPAVEHDGIEIGCCECCSVIYYRHNGRWFTQPGAD